jgi:hypothetical protein
VALGLADNSGQGGNLHAVPFLAEEAGTITSTLSTMEGVLTTFTTHGHGSSLGSYTSTGFTIVQGNTLSGRQTFTVNGDQFVMTFTGTVGPAGNVVGTFTLGVGTGRFKGIEGGGVFITAPDSDGTDFEQVFFGEMFLADHNQRSPAQ